MATAAVSIVWAINNSITDLESTNPATAEKRGKTMTRQRMKQLREMLATEIRLYKDELVDPAIDPPMTNADWAYLNDKVSQIIERLRS